MKKRMLILSIIPLFFFLLFSLLQLTGILEIPEYRMYDMFLQLKPSISEEPSILFVDIDDTSIEESDAPWPWPRDFYADGLLVLKEYAAQNMVFDMIYQEKSRPGINMSRYDGVQKTIVDEYAILQQDFVAIADALLQGDLPVEYFKDIAYEYLDTFAYSSGRVLGEVNMLAEDQDEYFGKAAGYFGKTSFVINAEFEEKKKKDLSEKSEHLFYQNIKVFSDKIRKVPNIIPPIAPLEANAYTFGFPQNFIDNDGVMRRIELFYEYEGKFIPQLAFSALLGMMQNPAIEVYTDHLILRDAFHPIQKKKMDISIPLDEHGHMLINWPAKKYIPSFRHISFWWLIRHERDLEGIVQDLEVIAKRERTARIFSEDKISKFLEDTYYKAQTMMPLLLEKDPGVSFEAYMALRNEFYEKLDYYLSPEKEQELIEGIDRVSYSDSEQIEIYNGIKAAYKDIRENYYPSFNAIREILLKEVPGSICFASWTAVSTTDIGVNPFDNEYVNVGMHASITNTILQQQFLDDTPSWIPVLLTLLLTAATYFVIQRIKRPFFSVLTGSGGIVVVFIGFAVFFIATGIYIGVLAPFLSVVFTFATLTVINFLQTAKEKNFIRNAFSHYLSKDVISELIADPDKLKLGGVERRITAMFTDIKGFSTLSETLTPEHLVLLLNEYLTEMSNVILKLGGTIDKYIGDAIIAFFGAPVMMENHAEIACRSAVLMHKIEMKLNEHLLAEGKSHVPLFTRIGINTGEMVVGNMGTAKKLNYTIMGNHVNFAARLEGVNKQYGTAILIAQATFEEGASAFLTRKLDRVQVVGIKKPVQIYELIDEKSEAKPGMFETVALFEEALGLFHNREWDRAKSMFHKVLKLNENDGPAAVFIKRCIEFKKKPPANDWNGVFTLKTK